MAHVTSKIQSTELDFFEIREALKTFLKSQSEFQDYDFEGSSLSVIIDLLAYNTHLISLQSNFSINESFLDSASIRENVVSLAKHLNYTPTSRKSPKAVLDISFNPNDSPSVITIERGTQWKTAINNQTYFFVNLEGHDIVPINGVYELEGLEVFEGTLLDYQFTVDINDSNQRFVIPNKGVDTDSLEVIVQNSDTDTTSFQYTKATTIDNISSSDRVFWIQEVEDEKHELVFGDDVVGRALVDGNIIKVNYLVSQGPAANKASSFQAVSSIGGYTGNEVSFTTATPAAGGAVIESIETIKFLAPKLYQTQGRAVTKNDYKNILLKERPDIESITIWGGEDADPPSFGRVFIALKPKNAESYSERTKQSIVNNVLKPVAVVSVAPVLVDPDFTYVYVDVEVSYDPTLLTTNVSVLETTVKDEIKEYFEINLNKFESKFRFSVLSSIIDDSEQSIKSNNTSITIQKRIKPTIDVTTSYELKFNNSILSGTLETNKFKPSGFTQTDYFIEDDSDGIVRIVRITSQGIKTILQNIGTIDYSTGEIIIDNLSISSIADGTDTIRLSVSPDSKDLTPLRDQIISLDVDDPDSIKITSISDNA